MNKVGIIILISLAIYAFSPFEAIANTDNCSDVLIIFARGSDQPQGDRPEDLLRKPEMVKFVEEIKTRAPEDIDLELNELVYPAAGVWHFGEAELSWIPGEYNNSVQEGVKSAVNLIEAEANRCPNQAIVLGGYSQGAHVMGDTLFQLSSNAASRIAYVGLFGDPKFKADSYAARGNFVNRTGGILEARDQEFPAQFSGRVESWCRYFDGVCENRFEAIGGPLSAHGKYPDPEIPIAANNAASKLASFNSNFIPKHIKPGLLGEKVDVMYAISTSAQMDFPLDNLRANSLAVAAHTTALGLDTRTGVVVFNDTAFGCDIKQPETRLDLVNNQSILNNQLVSLSGSCGGGSNTVAGRAEPYNGDDVYGGLSKAINEQSWRPDAKKLIVLLATNWPNVPDKYDPGVLESTIVNSAVSQDISIVGVVRGSLVLNDRDKLFTNLAEKTNGQMVFGRYASNLFFFPLTSHLLPLLTGLPNRPIAKLAPIKPTQPGQPVTFNAGGSYDPDGAIVKYEWDFDNDGQYDASTTQPFTTHIYNAVYNGQAMLRVTSSDGSSASIATAVSVDYVNLVPVPPPAPVTVTINLQPDNAAIVNWNSGIGSFSLDSAATPDSYIIKKANGEVLGIVSGATNSVTITDLPVGEPIQVAVAAGNDVGYSAAIASQTVTIENPASSPGRSSPSSGEIVGSSVGLSAASGALLTKRASNLSANIAEVLTGEVLQKVGQIINSNQQIQQPAEVLASKSEESNRPKLLIPIAIAIVAGIVLLALTIRRFRLHRKL